MGELGLPVEFREFDVSTKSSALAAQALGCAVAEIAKSVVFRGRRPGVVVISGDRRVDPARVAAVVGAEVGKADAGYVRESTGYPIGGVPPFPHRAEVTVLPDASLRRFEWVWAAGGAPNAVFRVRSSDMLSTIGGGPVDVAEEA